MCGITGMIGRPKNKRIANLSYQLSSKLLAETVVRGSHATGSYALLPPKTEGGKNRVFVYKLDAASTQYVTTNIWKKMRQDGDPFLLLGHCRFYTHGSPQDHINNHPHVSDDRKLALIHNGVISGYEGLKKTYKVQGECDSEVILRIIESENDVLEGIRKVFRVIVTGSMACMVCHYDSKNKVGHFYAFRNEGNPIVYVDLREQWGQMFMASTEAIMSKAMKNCGLPKAIQALPVIEIPSYEIWHCTTENLEWETEKVERSWDVGPSNYYSNYSYNRGTTYNRNSSTSRFGQTCGGTGATVPATTTSKSTTDDKDLTEIRGLLDTIIGSVTEIDEELTAGNSLGSSTEDLKDTLKAVAWDLERIVNPALAGDLTGDEDTEVFD